MAGHSKWKQIKHKKALLDSRKGKAFTKLIKEISVAARVGGGDPASNPRLRFLLEKGRTLNMPQDNAIRAIKKGTGELPGQHYEAYTYEGYGPGNIAVIVEVLTDNKNKAIAELRHTFSRNGGRIADSGSVSWMFERCGVMRTGIWNFSEEALIEKLLDYAVRDISAFDGTFEITVDPKSLDIVKNFLIQSVNCPIQEAELEWVAQSPLSLTGEEQERAVSFLEAIEDLDDVQNVYTSME
jgi:YebC/PmpR family DNA-binding regulatory protein